MLQCTNKSITARTTDDLCSRDQKSGVRGQHTGTRSEVLGSSPNDFDQKENLLKVFYMKKQYNNMNLSRVSETAGSGCAYTNPATIPKGESPLAKVKFTT